MAFLSIVTRKVQYSCCEKTISNFFQNFASANDGIIFLPEILEISQTFWNLRFSGFWVLITFMRKPQDEATFFLKIKKLVRFYTLKMS